jgi:tetratricopeptide (TPR) repeat protein
VKPETVLLSSGHALVLDFGVAKALRDAAAHGSGTTAGVALGTPLYMAPEQAAGGGGVDGRADLYALGVVLYEMLAGRPPFESNSAYDLIGAHLADPPPPLGPRSGPTSPALERIVMRCLAKRPADRFARAEELLSALDAVATPSASLAAPRPARWVLAIAGVAVAVVVGAVWAAGALRPRSLVAEGSLGAREPVLVTDFENRASDSTLAIAATEALRLDLAESPAVTLLAPARIHDALTRMRVPPGTPLRFALGRELAIREGIKAVIGGDVTRVGQSYVVAARIVKAETGEVLAGFRETARADAEIIAAVDRVSKELRRRIGESIRRVEDRTSLERVTTSSLDALAFYSRGIRAGGEGRHEQAAALFEQAIAIDSHFASAYRGLATALANMDTDPQRMMEAFVRAFELRDRLPERERLFAEASYYRDVEYRPDRVVAAYETVLQAHPDDRSALNNLALAFMQLGDTARALPLYRRSTRLYPSATTLGSLIQSEYNAGNGHAADSVLAAWSRTAPTDPGMISYRLMLLTARQRYDSADALAASLSSRSGDDRAWNTEIAGLLAGAARARGKLAAARKYSEQVVRARTASDTTGTRTAFELALDAAAVDIFLRDRPREGVARIETALRAARLEVVAPVDRPYLDLVNLYAAAGRGERARALLEERTRVFGDAGAAGRAMLLADSHFNYARVVRARTMVAIGRPGDAVGELRRHPDRGTASWLLADLGTAYDAAGQSDSALRVYEEFLAASWLRRFEADGWHRARILFRLGELYEQRGDRDRAADFYAQFARLWRDADPDLQPRVAEARRRLAVLTAE